MRAAVLCLLAFAAVACGPDLTEPADTNVSGNWFSPDTAAGVYNMSLVLTQVESGAVSGSWRGKTSPVNGQCDAELGCNPAGNVIGSNTVLQLYLAVTGMGDFTGQVTSSDTFRGNLLRGGSNYPIKFSRAVDGG